MKTLLSTNSQLPGRTTGQSYNGQLIQRAAYSDIQDGIIPDLRMFCLDLYRTFLQSTINSSALQFLPVFNNMIELTERDKRKIIRHTDSSHVLVDNKLMKVILIHWPSGKWSGIHGHPKGGCLLKVLSGELKEVRYSADETELGSTVLLPGGMAYIDDRMGLHAVGNDRNQSAISIHAYIK